MFIYPIFLLGLAAASVPLIIHLLNRRRAPRHDFSTLRFLRLAVERTAYRRRIDNLLLLILRTLLLILLALGLAQPFLRASTGRGAGAVAIVIDNSGSMALRHESASAYDRAKQGAVRLMGRVGDAASWALVFTNGPQEQEAAMTGDLERLAAELERRDIVPARADMSRALARAAQVLGKSGAPNKQIYVFSDMQRTSWKEVDSAALAPLDADAPVILVDIGAEGYRNLAVTSLEMVGGSPVAGAPVSVSAKVLNTSAAAVRDEVVTLHVGGVKQMQRAFDAGPGSAGTVVFNPTFSSSDIHTVSVHISGDSLDSDNVRYFGVRVMGRIPVLVVRPKGAGPSYTDDAYFIVRALDPSAIVASLPASLTEVRVVDEEDLGASDLAGASVVVTVNAGGLSRADAHLLAGYVRDGGRLIVFPGNKADPGFFRRTFPEDARLGLSPVPQIASEPVETVAPAPALAIRDVDFDHPALDVFRGLPQTLFEAVHVRRHLRLDVDEASPWSVLARLDGGDPFLVELAYGRGSVLFFAIPADRSWSNWPLTNSYVVMLNELVLQLAARGEVIEELTPGSAAHIALGPDADVKEVFVTDPSGYTTRVSAAAETGGREALYTDTYTVGVYTCSATQGGREPLASFIVNPNPAESDLTRADTSAVRGALRGRRVYVASSDKDIENIIQQLREGVRLVNFFMFAVLAIAVMESILANRGRSGRTPPRAAGSKDLELAA